MSEEKEKKSVQVMIPRDLHTKLKIHCVEKDILICDFVSKVIIESIKKIK